MSCSSDWLQPSSCDRQNSGEWKSDWVATYRQFWEQRLDRLEAYLQETQAAPPSAKKRKRTDARKRK